MLTIVLSSPARMIVKGKQRMTNAPHLKMWEGPYSTGPGYFDVMSIPLRGRDFRVDENKVESRVAIVNETFARRFYSGQEPIGKRFNFRGPDNPWWEIVGVAPDGKYNSLGENPKAGVFTPPFRDCDANVTLVARTRGDPRARSKRSRLK